jgi:putative hydrolase of the HAD superfamily/5'-nucleotidase
MNNYKWVLFDADDTLFHFDAFTGLKILFAHYAIDFTEQDYKDYELVNRPLWVEYQNGTITADQLKQERFRAWAERLNRSPEELNASFMDVMMGVCSPIEGAASLLNTLKGTVNLGIITNGFTQLQRARLDRVGFTDYFDVLVISDEVGVAKPNKEIFDHTLALMGHPQRDQVLMVGDNPASDIIGGLNSGLHTCWLNHHNHVAPDGIDPHYQVSSLSELEHLFLASRVVSNN